MNLCVVYELHIAYYKEIQAIIEAERRKNPEWVEEAPLYTGSEAGTQIDKELLLADKGCCRFSIHKTVTREVRFRWFKSKSDTIRFS